MRRAHANFGSSYLRCRRNRAHGEPCGRRSWLVVPTSVRILQRRSVGIATPVILRPRAIQMVLASRTQVSDGRRAPNLILATWCGPLRSIWNSTWRAIQPPTHH